MFRNKVILITGGTGSFGQVLVKKLINSSVKEIRILSRDEKKQEDMRNAYNNKKLKFFIGDVKDTNSIISSIQGCNYIFHAAALKQVPSCEFYPIEAVKTNVYGTENVIDAAVRENVEKVVL
jgi:Predicted nucleoside-diphosphate sugar epimerases